MASLRGHPSPPFREAVLQAEIELRGKQARSFQFEGGSRDPARALVCIAGMGANGRSFARQRPLAADRFVLLLNTPAKTPAGADPVVFAAEAVEDFLDSEKLERPVLVGSSFGGAVAALVAIRRAARLGGLLLVSPVLARSQIPLAFPGFLDFIDAPAPVARFLAPLAVQIMGGFALDRDGRDEIVRESRNFASPELKRRLKALLALDLIPALRESPVRIEWIHGSRDLLVPVGRARRAAAAVGAERFVLVPGAGHLPYLSHPRIFNTAVAAFLAPAPALESAAAAPP